MKSAFYRSLYLTIFFVSSNNCPESKAMFLTQLVLHDEGGLKGILTLMLSGIQASYCKPLKQCIPYYPHGHQYHY